jgi:xanthine dehydrogenase accessory factor
MKDLWAILCRVRDPSAVLTGAVLATIVRTVGSSYRQAGARLLLESDGTLTGVLSGGCLEADLLERAKAVRASGRVDLVTYDTSSPQEIVDGLGIGCNGTVLVLLEPWHLASPSVTFATFLLSENRCGVIATIFHVRGFPAVPWGARALVDEKTASFHLLADEGLGQLITEKARDALLATTTVTESLQLGAEVADVLFEFIAPPQSLAIFGAGPGSVALARLAKELGWRVTLVDHRDKASYARDFACVDKRVIGDFAHIQTSIELSPSLATVVMSHSFAADLEYLKILLPSSVRYVGLLGSRSRSNDLLAALSKSGLVLGNSAHDRLFNPVGLDIGAEGPEEIALAILSEIRAVFSARRGGFLKDRKGPIHERPSATSAR